ncbi:family 1 glycosylhydrolase [Spiroplasma taiwanense]|uniref:family 1 glycosylhydrolase n=1 Tax=Spiroplasma taiwanense TaxID=2145 RepID=UPI00040D6D2B|nr:family 1 glycosylhydrolase [Spiroplasma taiwanense]
MKNFKFGTATVAFQCEKNLNTGGRGKCIWDDVLLNNKSIAKYSPEPTSEFYKVYNTDFELAKKYGIEVLRVSIAWSRIFPSNSTEINKKQ